MDADARDAAYADAQAAYEAYEALTAEQQAQLTGADRFEALFGWFNAQVAPLANTASAAYDDFDAADGALKKSGGVTREGLVLNESTAESIAAETLSGQYYIVQGTVTIHGDLTVDGSTDGGLVFCDGATLTINGALIHTGGTKFHIYGQTKATDSQGTGRLIINNTGVGAAIQSTATPTPTLYIHSGELEINGGSSKKLVDNVNLSSTKQIHKGTLNGDTAPLADWSGNKSVQGKTLIIEYCKHSNATYERSGDTQHTKH